MLDRDLTRPITRPITRAVTQGLSGDVTPSVSFGQTLYIEGVDDASVVITIRNATDGALWQVTITSDGGVGSVSSSGSVSTRTFTTALNLSSLDPGTLTARYEEASVEVATASATLADSSAGSPIGLLLVLTKAA